MAYKYYLTDSLKAIADNNVRYFSRDASATALKYRFFDVLNPKKEDQRTAEEIVADILNRAGITFGERRDE